MPRICSYTGWGLEIKVFHSTERKASVYVPPLKGPDDINKLTFPTMEVDEKRTQDNFQIINEIIGDILGVKLDGVWIAVSLTPILMQLREFTQVMLDMYDRPKWVHRLMNFLCEGTESLLNSIEKRGLLKLNNRDDYVGSGGLGYTGELPGKEFESDHIRFSDICRFAESQDVPDISPSMHEEFILQYQVRLLKKFGLNCYGCCEPLDNKYEILRKVPNLRRVFVSPFADVKIAAEALEDKYIFS